MSDEEIVTSKLKSACECVRNGKSKNPLMTRKCAINILEDWLRDKNKPQTFKELCATVLMLETENRGLKQKLKDEKEKNQKLEKLRKVAIELGK